MRTAKQEGLRRVLFWRGLSPGGFRRDLGITWIYKLKQKKMLWATGGLLLFLLFVIRYVMILVDSGRLLIKGVAE